MRKIKLVLSFGVLAAALWLAREPILTAMGAYLVQTDKPKAAEVAIVLGGDSAGHRADMGCELLKRGLVKRVWFSGSQMMYGHMEADLGEEWARKRGCEAAKMAALHSPVDSTKDEAVGITARMRAEGIKEFILVTSNYHTRRAGALFRKYAPEMQVTVVAAADHDFPVDRWWKERPTRKTFAYEWAKTITSWFGV